jgi:CRP/FNR family cyclic AMP-dependent transcriptional regulator
VRLTTAIAISECSVIKLEKAVVLRLLHEEPSFSELFLAHLLSRSVRLEEDFVAHLFHQAGEGLGEFGSCE